MTAALNVPALVITIVLPVVLFVVGLWMVLLVWLRKRLERLQQAAVAELRGERVLLTTYKANYFGTLSLGVKQIRGNGVLVLTDKQLAFFMFKPKQRFSIPLETVSRVDTPNSFCYKTVAHPLLAVYYPDAAGAEDGMGFWVQDAGEWAAAVTEAAVLPGS